jgi:hypothetical protein
LAAEALIIQMFYDARDRILLVRIDRARRHACWLKAMVTRGCNVLHDWRHAGAAEQQANVAPCFVLVQSVERMARDHTSLATGATVEIDLKGVLLAGPGRCCG